MLVRTLTRLAAACRLLAYRPSADSRKMHATASLVRLIALAAITLWQAIQSRWEAHPSWLTLSEVGVAPQQRGGVVRLAREAATWQVRGSQEDPARYPKIPGDRCLSLHF